MKTVLISLMALLGIHTVSAQTNISSYFKGSETSLPYNTGTAKPKLDTQIKPQKMMALPYAQWGGKLDVSLWNDFNMTQSRPNNDIENVCIYRTFAPKGNYLVGILAVYAYGDDDSKTVMVTVHPTTGALIDQLEVGYFRAVGGMTNSNAYTKEFNVTSDNANLIVSVSQMKLPQNQMRPISLTSTVQASLVTKKYRISSSGLFELIKQTTGQTRSYSRDVFSATSKAFSEY